MDIRTRTNGGCTILDLTGRFLTDADSIALRTAVVEALATERTQIFLNLRGVSYIDSCGICELIKSHSTVRSRGGRLVLMDLPRRVKRLVDISRLDQVFEIYENEESAVAGMQQEPLSALKQIAR
jgi:anti-sigma B factor antagonist